MFSATITFITCILIYYLSPLPFHIAGLICSFADLDLVCLDNKGSGECERPCFQGQKSMDERVRDKIEGLSRPALKPVRRRTKDRKELWCT